MILTKDKILRLIHKKKIVVEPLDIKAIGPASIDLTLGNQLRIFTKSKELINLKSEVDYKNHTKLISIDKGYRLKPRELVLGMTVEDIKLPEDIAGWLNSRSRFARIGLMSHITAPFVLPGISGRPVLEIYNAGPRTIVLHPGIKICQIVLQECRGKARYEGIFKNQTLE